MRNDAAGCWAFVRVHFPIHVPVGVGVRALALEVVLQRRDVQMCVARRALKVLWALLCDAAHRTYEFSGDTCMAGSSGSGSRADYAMC